MSERTPTSGPRRIKSPYVKPEIKKVLLRPEEAVLAACKLASGSGPRTACQVGSSRCRAQGS